MNAVTGRDAYHWPEFKTFAERLGISYGSLTTDLVICIPREGFVKIAHEYTGIDGSLERMKKHTKENV